MLFCYRETPEIAFLESGWLTVQPQADGKLHLRLNIALRTIAFILWREVVKYFEKRVQTSYKFSKRIFSNHKHKYMFFFMLLKKIGQNPSKINFYFISIIRSQKINKCILNLTLNEIIARFRLSHSATTLRDGILKQSLPPQKKGIVKHWYINITYRQ